MAEAKETDAQQVQAVESGGKMLSKAALTAIGRRVLESYPAQTHLWINDRRQILFSEEGREGFIKVTKK
jgi:molybdenum-dependent DNA-binding transcriptional regulator ModE